MESGMTDMASAGTVGTSDFTCPKAYSLVHLWL